MGLEHPFDAALAAYLWVLSAKKPELAEQAAAAVLQSERCWWSRKLAERIAEERQNGAKGGGGIFPSFSLAKVQKRDVTVFSRDCADSRTAHASWSCCFRQS